MKHNGYVIFEDNIRVVIATGFARKSANVKTGDMIQLWILVKAENPVAAVASGMDEAVCGDCPLRGNVCYVNVGQAPLAIWKTWMRGGYPTMGKRYLTMFKGRKTRFGAYGDPTHIPLPILRRIAEYSDNWTGYTHQWRNPILQQYKQYLMASADTEADVAVAHGMGWRTFRVLAEGEEPQSGEINCPNYTKGVRCEDCTLCAGASRPAKSIVILAHGAKKKNFANARRNRNYTVTV